ncbi:probable cytochrome P450 6a13 [Microplitis demolitor]|uniref:probable cytochrome P450 6a13 n=1 Tax=Microplitis demolitor TaxID=69319 RepID=UPI0004CD8291|nr:probable cytochrome P450 6a13 [Microplitis demolitor]
MEFGAQEILVIIAGILLAFYYWSTSTYSHWKRLGVPGPKPTPLVGNLGPFFFGKISVNELLDELYNKWKHEPFFGIYNARTPALMITDPDLVRNILIKDFNIFPGRGIHVNKEDPLAEHLVSIDGHKWKVLRTKLTPIFTTGKLKLMVDLMLECVQHFEKYLKNHVGIGGVVDCREVAAKFTTDVIGSCAFGINMNALDREDSQFRIIGRKMFETSYYKMLKRLIREFAPRFSKLIGITGMPKTSADFFINTIRETMEFRESKNFVRHDLVDILRDIKKNQQEIDFEITENLLAAQAMVFFAAGFETSSTTISFALYELAIAPEVQEKLRTEILETLKRHNGQLSYDIVNEMKYLHMVIQETLRKDSPAGLLRRKSIQSYKLPGTNITLPAGTIVQIPIYSFHHDDRYYPSPETFDPERFNENEKRHPMVHLPFGDGPKNCIGARFAIYQSKLGLISVLKNFKVSPSKSTQVPYKIDITAIVLAADGGTHLQFDPLN